MGRTCACILVSLLFLSGSVVRQVDAIDKLKKLIRTEKGRMGSTSSKVIATDDEKKAGASGVGEADSDLLRGILHSDALGNGNVAGLTQVERCQSFTTQSACPAVCQWNQNGLFGSCKAKCENNQCGADDTKDCDNEGPMSGWSKKTCAVHWAHGNCDQQWFLDTHYCDCTCAEVPSQPTQAPTAAPLPPTVCDSNGWVAKQAELGHAFVYDDSGHVEGGTDCDGEGCDTASRCVFTAATDAGYSCTCACSVEDSTCTNADVTPTPAPTPAPPGPAPPPTPEPTPGPTPAPPLPAPGASCAPMCPDPDRNGKICSKNYPPEYGGNSVFQIRFGMAASEQACSEKCAEDADCIAYSMNAPFQCYGCRVPLSEGDDDPDPLVAYKKACGIRTTQSSCEVSDCLDDYFWDVTECKAYSQYSVTTVGSYCRTSTKFKWQSDQPSVSRAKQKCATDVAADAECSATFYMYLNGHGNGLYKCRCVKKGETCEERSDEDWTIYQLAADASCECPVHTSLQEAKNSRAHETPAVEQNRKRLIRSEKKRNPPGASKALPSPRKIGGEVEMDSFGDILSHYGEGDPTMSAGPAAGKEDVHGAASSSSTIQPFQHHPAAAVMEGSGDIEVFAKPEMLSDSASPDDRNQAANQALTLPAAPP